MRKPARSPLSHTRTFLHVACARPNGQPTVAPLVDRLSRRGTLSVDPLASSSTVQGVEYVLTGFDSLVNWARKSSLWPMTFGLA